MYNLKIINSTVRPGRKGPLVMNWIAGVAEKHGAFNVEVVDLAQVDLPMMNEPNHPSMKKYIHEHTKNWSAKIDSADAFVFVTAEYDYNYPAPLRNAIEYLFKEWNYKAAGLVSYGGVSGGTRAANSLKNDLASVKAVALTEAVNFPFFTKNINDQDEFVVNEVSEKAAKTMLDELVRWTGALQVLRQKQG